MHEQAKVEMIWHSGEFNIPLVETEKLFKWIPLSFIFISSWNLLYILIYLCFEVLLKYSYIVNVCKTMLSNNFISTSVSTWRIGDNRWPQLNVHHYYLSYVKMQQQERTYVVSQRYYVAYCCMKGLPVIVCVCLVERTGVDQVNPLKTLFICRTIVESQSCLPLLPHTGEKDHRV